jgi:hypothetical protein
MTDEPPVLVVAIEIGEAELADRLTALLGDIPGLIPRVIAADRREPNRAFRWR